MWALGKCVATPEVMRVYLGSFWEQPYREGTNHALFKAEKGDLYKDLAMLPKVCTTLLHYANESFTCWETLLCVYIIKNPISQNASIRKINDLIKRARAAKVHALLLGHLRSQMPMFWKEAKQVKCILFLLVIVSLLTNFVLSLPYAILYHDLSRKN